MSRLTAAGRRKLKLSDFAIPETRSYPLPDHNHALAALSDVAKFGTDDEKERVRAAVRKKFPAMNLYDQVKGRR